ncbi:Oxysterol-binding protein 4 [Sorochytrium milnesiophthora]
MADEAEAAAVPQQFRSQFMQFIKTLASFTGDLSQLTCPAFLLSGTSLLEYSQHWADHPKLFSAIAALRPGASDLVSVADASGSNPSINAAQQHTVESERMVAVLRWFFAYLHGSFYSRAAAGEKKPFNPVLGEVYRGKWTTNGDGDTRMLCEQVSHHPPIGAFYVENRKLGITLNGHCGQKTKFKTTSINVQQTGRAVLTVYDGQLPSEEQGGKMPAVLDEYFISLPEMVLRGLLSGHIFVEMMGHSRISSLSGYTAHIEYVPKPWFGGDYHVVKGYISRTDDEKTPLYELSGKWTETSYIARIGVDGQTSSGKSSKKDKKHKHNKSDASSVTSNTGGNMSPMSPGTPLPASETLFDPTDLPSVPPTLKPVEEQGELESTRLWGGVGQALQAGDYTTATKEKTAIEDRQRELRKARAQQEEDWHPEYFVWCPDDAAASARPSSSTSKTSGGGDNDDDDDADEFTDARSNPDESATPPQPGSLSASLGSLANLTAYKDNNKNLDTGLWRFKRSAVPW